MSKKTGRRSRRWFLFLILAVAALVIFHESVFRYLAQVLITSETPEKSDIAIILAGDSFGERILKGCELIREGYAPKALVSGPKVFYGRHEDEFAIQWATDRGCDRDWFEGVPNELKSTKDEAQMFGRILRERGAKTYLLVTSDFHTARAARIFRKEIPDIRAVIVAAPYPEFDPNAWWKERQQRKVFVLEWLKTVTEPFGI